MTAYSVSPQGVVTAFREVGWIKWNKDGTASLFEDKKSNGELDGFVARVPADHIVTFNQPGVEYKGSPKAFTPDAALDIVARCIRSFGADDRWGKQFKNLQTIKDELAAFDARGPGWGS